MKRFRRGFILLCALLMTGLSCVSLYYELSGGISPVRATAAAVLTPFQRGISSAWALGEDAAAAVFAYRELEKENEALRIQLAEGSARVREAQRLSGENEALRELLGLQKRYIGLDLLPAAVIAVTGTGSGALYTLERGSADGICEGCAVVTSAGMVGVISTVGENWCELTPLTSAAFYAGIEISRTGETGIAQGAEVPELSLLPSDARAYVGDRVVTSGLGVLPPNLLIGRIKKLWTQEDGLSRSAQIAPAARMENSEYCYIVRSFELTR